jgi:hypothetical protein
MRDRSLRRTFAGMVLGGEVLVVGFAALVAKDLADVPGRWVLAAAVAIAVLCVVAAGLLRSRAGYLLGWLVQLLLVATAVRVPLMGLVSVLFLGLWVAALVLGGRADEVSARRRAAASGRPPATDSPG